MSSSVATTAPPPPELREQEEEAALFHLLDELEAFKVEGRDKRGRRILRIVGKFFPARLVKPAVLIRYLEKTVFPELLGQEKKKKKEGDVVGSGGGGGAPFVVVYVHTYVQRMENFPGVSALRTIYESLAPAVRDNLEAVYFVHPGLQSRLFFATFGRFLFSAGLYGKLRYVSRLEFLWEHMRRGEVEVPEFVHDHDEELEHRPLMDYGLESDHHHHRAYDAPAMDTAASMYSLRCIS